MVITGLTRNQFVPKAHEGSNPSLCAKKERSGYSDRSFFVTVGRSPNPARIASQGSHTPLVDRQACLSGVECEYLRLRRIPLPQLHHSVLLHFFLLAQRERILTLHRKVRGFAYAKRICVASSIQHRIKPMRNDNCKFITSSIPLPLRQ